MSCAASPAPSMVSERAGARPGALRRAVPGARRRVRLAARHHRPTGPARWGVELLAVLALVVLARGVAAEPVTVSSDSMLPTLARGDTVLLDKLTPRWAEVEPGQLVAFSSPDDGAPTLKRVVGVAGDVVAVRDAVLHVNDERVEEPYVDHASVDGSYFGPVPVPEGTVFVLGDNRANSIDSRDYGPVPLDRVTGRVLFQIWP
jgi:signal peptidase I